MTFFKFFLEAWITIFLIKAIKMLTHFKLFSGNQVFNGRLEGGRASQVVMSGKKKRKTNLCLTGSTNDNYYRSDYRCG